MNHFNHLFLSLTESKHRMQQLETAITLTYRDLHLVQHTG